MRRLLLLALCSTLIVSLVGCRRSSKTSTQAAVLRYPLPFEPASLDPAKINETPTLELLQNVLEGLVTFDAQNRIRPLLAERWELSADRRSYTFHLNPKARFHNGRSVEAADVKFSLERALRPETKSGIAANYLGGIVGADDLAAGKRTDLPGVEIVDAHTVTITLDKPRAYFLGALVYPTGWVLCREALEANGGVVDERSMVGTGPFKLAEYRHGGKFTLLANTAYYGGAPKLARIERPIVRDPQTAHAMYENGQLDLCGITPGDYLSDIKNPALKDQIHLMPSAAVVFLVLHPRLQAAFAKPAVRKAIAMCIDRDEIVRVAGQGMWTRCDGFLPPGFPAHNPALRKIPLDVDAARRLLADAGYGPGTPLPRLTLVYAQSFPDIASVAQILRANLKKAGIEVDLQEREAAMLRSELYAQKVPFTISDWGPDYIDPQSYLSTLLHSGAPLNFFGYANPRFDALSEQADAESDEAKRAGLYQQAEQMAIDDVALIPLYCGSARILAKPYLRDWERNVMSFLPHWRTRIQR